MDHGILTKLIGLVDKTLKIKKYSTRKIDFGSITPAKPEICQRETAIGLVSSDLVIT